jgi:Zn-dependent M28 family amino/carboxypeptidase
MRRLVSIIVVAFLLPIALFWIVMAQPSFSANQKSDMSVDTGRLREHVLALSEKYYPRSYANISNLNMCADYVMAHFKQAGADTTAQEFRVGNNSYRNVIGFFGPDSTDRIVVGAHYDAYNGTPGADDNSSGVAGLIELAYLLGKADLDSKVELVAYTLEEPPFFRTADMGSAHHARSLKDQQVEVRAMIALEMIGFFSDEKNSQSFPIPMLKLFYPSRGNFIAVVGRLGQRRIVRQVKKHMKGTTDLPVYSINAPAFVPGIDFSDHGSYWKHGYDAVMITDTAFYRNSRYHESKDTADSLDYERMSKVVVSVFEAVQGLCGE